MFEKLEKFAMHLAALAAALALLFAFAAPLDAAGPDAAAQRILVIHSEKTELSKELLRTVKVVFSTVKLDYKCVECSDYDLDAELDALGEDGLLVCCSDSLPSMRSQAAIVRYVSGGGRVFFAAFDGGCEPILKLIGVEQVGASITETGMKSAVSPAIFPGLEQSGSAYSQMKSSCLEVKLASDAEVLYTSSIRQPLVWRRGFGKGSAVVCNSNLFADIGNAGLMLQLMSLQNSFFLYTVFNAKLFFIDDFPSPIPLGTGYVISSNYNGMGYAEFYKAIWWPQMKALAQRRDLKFTCLALGNYENSVKMPPPPLQAKMLDTFKYYGDDIVESGHELGVHGYNHAPLLLADFTAALKDLGYVPWSSHKDMVCSLKRLRKALDDALGPRQYLTYVPPMNMLSKEGKSAILEVFPEVKSFAGLGDAVQYGNGVLFQDVGPDPDFPKVYAIPRYSSGYLSSTQTTWEIANYIAYCGMFSHFVHPDELLDNERSANKNWQELYNDLERIVREVDDRYPFLRPMKACDFAAERERVDKGLAVRASRSGDRLSISCSSGSSGPFFHYLRLNRGLFVKSVENGKAYPVPGVNGLYLIEGSKLGVSILLGHGEADAK